MRRSLAATVWLAAALAADGPTSERLEDWTQVAAIRLQAQLHHVQGIDVEGATLWVSSVHRRAGKGYVTRFELPSGRMVRQVEVQEGKRIHPGD